MDIKKMIDCLIYDMENENWEKVNLTVGNILKNASYDILDTIDFETKGNVSIWISVLLKSGLYRSSEKGQYLTKKLIKIIWNRSLDVDRYRLFFCFSLLFDVLIPERISEQDALKIVANISEAMGLKEGEVVDVIVKNYDIASRCAVTNHISS